MKYSIIPTSSYKSDLKKIIKQHKDLDEVNKVINNISNGIKFEDKYKDHQLSGNYKGCRECHIEPDLLLIYRLENGKVILVLIRIGSHSDLY